MFKVAGLLPGDLVSVLPASAPYYVFGSLIVICVLW